MSFTHRFTNTYGSGGTLLGGFSDVVGDSEQNVSHSIPNNTADFALGVDWDADKLTSVFIKVTKDCTLEVNDSATPDQTIALKADFPFSWMKDSGVPYPFVDVDGAPLAVVDMFVTVPTSDPVAACQFDMRTTVDF